MSAAYSSPPSLLYKADTNYSDRFFGTGLFFSCIPLSCILDKQVLIRTLLHGFLGNRTRIVRIILGIVGACTVLIGIGIGIAAAATRNIQNFESIGEYQPAVPSQILDIKDRLITEFFSDEKREIVSIDELPRHLIYALITREDKDFFNHHGFSFRGTLRAVLNLLTGRYFSGGSTINQQLAGQLDADRPDISITRKLKELWWAFQLERSLTKYEILELYLNKMYFGSGVYGVEAASRFYFNHSARELTLAESVALVGQLPTPSDTIQLRILTD